MDLVLKLVTCVENKNSRLEIAHVKQRVFRFVYMSLILTVLFSVLLVAVFRAFCGKFARYFIREI